MTVLLKEIRRIILKIETNTSMYDTMDEAKALYYTYRQEQHKSNSKHLQNFKSIMETIEYLGGKIFADDTLYNYEKKGTTKSNNEIRKIVREKLMAVALLKRCKHENKKLMQTIRDQHAFGLDVYPKTLHDAYELLENHSSTDSAKRDNEQRNRREREHPRRNHGRG